MKYPDSSPGFSRSAKVAAQELVIQVDVLFQINFKLLIRIQVIRCTQAIERIQASRAGCFMSCTALAKLSAGTAHFIEILQSVELASIGQQIPE
jgi:hypothetical protein